MKEYRVNIRPTAQIDIENRYFEIAEDSPDNAINWYLNIIAAIEKLDKMAERCPIAPEDEDIQKGIRYLNIHNYRVLYYIEENSVEVLHVRGDSHQRIM